MNLLIFGELIVSNNFHLLLSHTLSLFNPMTGLGVYIQGLPIPNSSDFFWGTNAGVRTLPLLSMLMLLQKICTDTWQVVYLALSLFLPFIAFLLAYRIIGKITPFTILAALFFGGNVWIINRLFTGFWQLNIVYALLPFLVTIPVKIAVEKKYTSIELLYYSSLYAVFSSVILTSQPHFLVIVSIFSISYLISFLAKKQFQSFFNLVTLLLVNIPIFICINVYFIIPGFFFSETAYTASNQYFSLASVIFNSQGNYLEHVLRFDPLGFSQGSFTWNWIAYLQLFPLLIFFLLFILNKKKTYLYILLVLLFLFLAKGFHEPFENISIWIYENVFFMHFFRDPSRFLSGVALFASLSIAEFEYKKRFSRLQKTVVIFLSIALFLLINIHVFQEPKSIVFQKTTIPQSYVSMQTFINTHITDTKNHRLLLLPNAHGLAGYPWYKSSSPNSSVTIFDNILPLTIPLADGTTYPDTYGNQVAAYLYTKFTEAYNPRYLAPLGVSHILVDSSIIAPLDEMNIATSAATQLKNPEYKTIHTEEGLSLFSVQRPSSVFSSEEPIFAIGNLETIGKLIKSGETRPIILLNQPENTTTKKESVVRNHMVFIDSPIPTIEYVGEKLANHYSVNILKAGWNYDQQFGNYEPYKMKYVKTSGALYTSGMSVISSPTITKPMRIDHTLPANTYHIVLKSISITPLALSVTIDGIEKKIAIDTNEQLSWQDAGTITSRNTVKEITLSKDTTDQLIIDQFLLIPENEYQHEMQRTKDMLATMKPYNELPTSTKILKLPVDTAYDTIALPEPMQFFTGNISYGKYWQSDTPSDVFISNGYGMTFISDKSPFKNVVYTANKSYQFSRILSGVSCSFVLGFILWIRLKRK